MNRYEKQEVKEKGYKSGLYYRGVVWGFLKPTIIWALCTGVIIFILNQTF